MWKLEPGELLNEMFLDNFNLTPKLIFRVCKRNLGEFSIYMYHQLLLA